MKTKLLKSMRVLLVAAGLLIGSANAWAAVGDKTTNLDIDFSNAISDGVVAGATGSMTIGGSGYSPRVCGGCCHLEAMWCRHHIRLEEKQN